MKRHDLTIASGAAKSEPFEFGESLFLKVYMGDGWTAADLAFEAAPEQAGPYGPLKDEYGTLLSSAAAADDVIRVPHTWLAGCPWLKLWSHSAGVDENQGAAREITVVQA